MQLHQLVGSVLHSLPVMAEDPDSLLSGTSPSSTYLALGRLWLILHVPESTEFVTGTCPGAQ